MNKYNITRVGQAVENQTEMKGHNGINIRKDGVMGTSWRFFDLRNKPHDFFFSDEILEGQSIDDTISYIVYKLGEENETNSTQ